MFSKFFKSTLLLLLAFGFSAHSTIVNLPHVAYAKQASKTETISATLHSDDSRQPATLNLLFGQTGAAHLTSEDYRPSHFVKHAVIFNAAVFVAANCSRYISHSSQLSFSRFRKLVLFPFHGFW